MKLFDRLIIDSDEEEMKEDFNSHRSCDFFKKKKEKKKKKKVTLTLTETHRVWSPQYQPIPHRNNSKSVRKWIVTDISVSDKTNPHAAGFYWQEPHFRFGLKVEIHLSYFTCLS